ncbi:MAG: Uncharacterised protein [Cyanobium sp. ARS6]|nr:MAG: Uncharacterised protein [Cyanobium sp. ARS6]
MNPIERQLVMAKRRVGRLATETLLAFGHPR